MILQIANISSTDIQQHSYQSLTSTERGNFTYLTMCAFCHLVKNWTFGVCIYKKYFVIFVKRNELFKNPFSYLKRSVIFSWCILYITPCVGDSMHYKWLCLLMHCKSVSSAFLIQCSLCVQRLLNFCKCWRHACQVLLMKNRE